MDTCEHAEQLRIMWADFTDYGPNWCGQIDPHSPHDACAGIFCDFGCNAEVF